MNDRYLYRAKRVDNGEWIEGYYAYAYEKHYIMTVGATCALPPYHWYFQNNEVDPSTICQCTGLKDKNGKLIWENDIMCGHLDDKFPEDITYTRVLWRKNGFCTNERNSLDFELLDDFDKEYFEVCGNIFDNPELLEVGE